MNLIRTWLILGAVLPVAAPGQPLAVVRVGLTSMGAASEFHVTADSAFGAYDATTGLLVEWWPEGTAVVVRAEGEGVRLGAHTLSAAYFSPEGPKLQLKGPARARSYRGWLHFSARAGRLLAVNEVPLETYLMGVVPCEMGPSSPLEALKAQAVAARTYTLRKIGAFRQDGFDVDDTTRSQTYKGSDAEHQRTNEAVRATANQILAYGGRPIEALFATVSGGVTASAVEAFGGMRAPYLISIRDVDEAGRPFAERHPLFRWVYEVSSDEFGRVVAVAGYTVGKLTALEVVERTESGRVALVEIIGEKGRAMLTGAEFRRAVGLDKLRSTLFDASKTERGWRFDGRGWGHGVGMCQAGAKGRALAGQTYQQILAAYYVGASLTTVRGSPLELASRGSLVDRRKFSRRSP